MIRHLIYIYIHIYIYIYIYIYICGVSSIPGLMQISLLYFTHFSSASFCVLCVLFVCVCVCVCVWVCYLRRNIKNLKVVHPGLEHAFADFGSWPPIYLTYERFQLSIQTFFHFSLMNWLLQAYYKVLKKITYFTSMNWVCHLKRNCLGHLKYEQSMTIDMKNCLLVGKVRYVSISQRKA